MKKLPLRYRLALMIAISLLLCCLAIVLCVMNSAIGGLNTIGTEKLSISSENQSEISVEIDIAQVIPELEDQIAQVKKDLIIQSIIITLIVFVIGLLATITITRLALKPLLELSRALEKTDETNLCSLLPEPEADDEIKTVTRSLNAMKLRLCKVFEAQKQFSANAAHEIRTPLSVMTTSMEVLQKDENAGLEEYKNTVNKTLVQLERMNCMVNTLLDMNRFSTLEKKDSVNLDELIEEIQYDLLPLATEKQVEIEYIPPKDKDQMLLANCNELMIYRAIYNLAENAIKYNRENGRVFISLTREKDTFTPSREKDAFSPSRERDTFVIRVKDTGIGIEKEQQEKIFDPFYRVDKSRSRKSGGAGLGLALVKEIVEGHNGRLFVEQSSPEGTVMRMEL